MDTVIYVDGRWLRNCRVARIGVWATKEEFEFVAEKFELYPLAMG